MRQTEMQPEPRPRATHRDSRCATTQAPRPSTLVRRLRARTADLAKQPSSPSHAKASQEPIPTECPQPASLVERGCGRLDTTDSDFLSQGKENCESGDNERDRGSETPHACEWLHLERKSAQDKPRDTGKTRNRKSCRRRLRFTAPKFDTCECRKRKCGNCRCSDLGL